MKDFTTAKLLQVIEDHGGAEEVAKALNTAYDLLVDYKLSEDGLTPEYISPAIDAVRSLRNALLSGAGIIDLK